MNLFNKFIAALLPIVPKVIVKKVSSRYIAGSTIPEALTVVRKLNVEGAMATVDVLGEYIKSMSEATENTRYSLEVLEAIASEKIDSNISIKLTSLGLGLDDNACEANVRKILDAAKLRGNFVRIDMEDSSYTTRTLALYDTLRKEYDNIGVVLQAYLHRTESDIIALTATGKTNFRLCKGIYIESESIAFKDREEVRANYLKCLDLLLSAGSYVGIATHDDYLTTEAEKLIKNYHRTRNEYEFQMLLGVRDQLRLSLLKAGHRLRVYVPFGADWYGYSVRRLKENPSVAGYIVKAMFGGGK